MGLVGDGNAALEAAAKGKIGSVIKGFFGGEGMKTALGYGKGILEHEGVGKVAANAAFMGSVGAVGNTVYQAGVNQDYNVLGNGIQGFMGGAVVGAGVAGIGLARKALMSNAGKGAEAVAGAAKPLGKLRGVQGGPNEISDARYMASLADMEKQGARRAAEREAALRPGVIDPSAYELGSVGSMWNRPINANRNAGVPTMPEAFAHSRSGAVVGDSKKAAFDRAMMGNEFGGATRPGGELNAISSNNPHFDLGGEIDREISANKAMAQRAMDKTQAAKIEANRGSYAAHLLREDTKIHGLPGDLNANKVIINVQEMLDSPLQPLVGSNKARPLHSNNLLLDGFGGATVPYSPSNSFTTPNGKTASLHSWNAPVYSTTRKVRKGPMEGR